MKLNLAVIFGSRTCEHDVSIISGLQALGALLFTAGMFRMRTQPQEESSAQGKVRGVAYVEAKALVAQLAQICEAVDVCMSDLALVQAAGAQTRLSGTADEAMLDLLIALMEAKTSGRNEMAMRSLSLAEEYLHMLGMEIIPYEAENAALFDMLPTMGAPRTIRPALMKNGKLVRRGVAAVAKERGMGV
jgi:hypothetical protein